MSGTPSPHIQRRYATITNAAALYGLHPKTLRRYIGEGRITAFRIGPRNLRVDLDEVDAKLVRPIPGGNGGRAA